MVSKPREKQIDLRKLVGLLTLFAVGGSMVRSKMELMATKEDPWKEMARKGGGMLGQPRRPTICEVPRKVRPKVEKKRGHVRRARKR